MLIHYSFDKKKGVCTVNVKEMAEILVYFSIQCTMQFKGNVNLSGTTLEPNRPSLACETQYPKNKRVK